ncbi:MAG: GAF domain-containing sensor histidine kinase [Chloroflexi bacterium]|nr:GAF domain-containing sensor histidine kinase [Chloroflexota bacterium]
MSAQTSPSSPDENISLEQYQRLMRRYERLMEISRQLNSMLDLGALLKRILEAAIELTETEQASILLIDPSTGELRFEASSNLTRAEMEAIPVPMTGSLAGWVFTKGEPVLVSDVRSDSRWFPRVEKTTKLITRNLLAVPMNLQNKPIGVVEAINKRDDRSWTEDDVNTLTALANQAATAIQNARLFQQSDFIAEMVHELRSPLAALKASTALLLRPTLPATMREEIVYTLQEETERLSALTTDFLDLARLESGRSRLQTEIFDLYELVEECVEFVQPRAAERGIQIEIRGLHGQAHADRDKIKQVLLNLLTNAIKYNLEHGAITCTLDRSEDEEGCLPICLVASVRDTGHGLSEEDQKRVFDKFFRAAATANSVGGTGLGLSIAKRIIEAHGGEMWLESALGVGTTFYFSLPALDENISIRYDRPGKIAPPI